MKIIFVFGVLVTVCSSVAGNSQLFPLDKELIYEWKTNIMTGMVLPSNLMDTWTSELLIKVQQIQPNITLFKIYNETENSETPLFLPFKASYNSGELAQLLVDPEDDLWSINIKRAVVSLFQLKLDRLRSTAFVTEELNLHGKCKAEYSVEQAFTNELIIKKMLDLNKCWNTPVERTANTAAFICPTPGQKFESLNSERVYHVTPLDDVLIKMVTASGVVLEQPYQAQAEAHYSKLFQNITFIQMSTIQVPIEVSEKLEPVDLIYENLNLDPSFGTEPANKSLVIEKILDMMGEVSDSLSAWQIGVEGLDNQTAFHLLDLMWWLKSSDWKQLYETVTLGTSYRQETIQHLFWELVPQVGSEESVLFIKDLIVSGTIKGSLATKVLANFPFYLRHPSEQLLAKCQELLRVEEDTERGDIKSASILSFASLVSKTCATGCKTETIDKYAKMYLDKFTESTDYWSQMIYLQGLANLELSQALDFLVPVIKGQETTNRHLRFLASWATLHTVYVDSNKIFEVFWPIFINREESLEMRVVALTLLIMSKPTASRFLSIFWHMKSEPSQQIYNYYYTTIHSLSNSNYPCYSVLAEGARKLARFVAPKSRQWATGNYILDFEDTDRGFGGLIQALLVASENTGLPNVFIFMSDQHSLALSKQYALYLKLEGLDTAINEELYKISENKSLEFNKILELLQNLKVPQQTPEDLHLEIIFKINSRTVYANYMNKTTFNELLKEIRRLIQLYLEFSVNYQSMIVWGPGLSWTRPSDMGTPITFLVRSSSLISARGSISQYSKGLAGNAQLDIRCSWNGLTSLRSFNPLRGRWHGADRCRNLHMVLPFATRLNLHVPQTVRNGPLRTAIFNVTAVRHKDFKPGSRLGLVWHSSTRLISTLPSNVQHHNISNIWSMESEDMGSKLGADVFDCKDPETLPDALHLLKTAFMTNHKNYKMVPGGVILLAFLSLQDQLHIQPYGPSCGLILYFSPLKNHVEPVLEVVDDGVKVSMSREDGLVWEVVVGTRRLRNTNKEFSFKLYRTPRVASEAAWRVLQLEGAFEAPSRDALPPALALSGYAFLSWGAGPAHSARASVIDVKIDPGHPAPACSAPVPACLQAASDLAASQTATITYNNLPSWIKTTAHALFPEHVQTESTKTQISFAYPVALLPWNTKGLCAVNGGSVLTLDNATVPTTLSQCYSLAVADCSSNSKFAVLVNRNGNTLGAKIYSRQNEIILEASDVGISGVLLNGVEMKNLSSSDSHMKPLTTSSVLVSRTESGIVEVEIRDGVVVRHYNSTVVVLVPGFFRGDTCGLCGDFNGDTSREPSLSYSHC